MFVKNRLNTKTLEKANGKVQFLNTKSTSLLLTYLYFLGLQMLRNTDISRKTEYTVKLCYNHGLSQGRARGGPCPPPWSPKIVFFFTFFEENSVFLGN